MEVAPKSCCLIFSTSSRVLWAFKGDWNRKRSRQLDQSGPPSLSEKSCWSTTCCVWQPDCLHRGTVLYVIRVGTVHWGTGGVCHESKWRVDRERSIGSNDQQHRLPKSPRNRHDRLSTVGHQDIRNSGRSAVPRFFSRDERCNDHCDRPWYPRYQVWMGGDVRWKRNADSRERSHGSLFQRCILRVPHSQSASGNASSAETVRLSFKSAISWIMADPWKWIWCDHSAPRSSEATGRLGQASGCSWASITNSVSWHCYWCCSTKLCCLSQQISWRHHSGRHCLGERQLLWGWDAVWRRSQSCHRLRRPWSRFPQSLAQQVRRRTCRSCYEAGPCRMLPASAGCITKCVKLLDPSVCW